MNHVAKYLKVLKSFLFLALCGAGIETSAKTLKQLALSSNVLLVISDRINSDDPNLAKLNCGLNNEKISELSQKLKVEIDHKIAKLDDKDYSIIKNRIQTCEVDCSCDVYSLALEKKQITIESLNLKAAQISPKNRVKCISFLKDICKDSVIK